MKSTFALALAITAILTLSTKAMAFETSSKLLLTGGVSQVEGSAGGGLAPWAVIGGYGSQEEIGANVFATQAQSTDFTLESRGVLIGAFDRVELSYAQQIFNTRNLGVALGLGQDFRIKQNIIGVKVKVIGDAVLDQDSWLPQVALGAQFKKNEQGAIVATLGSQSESGTDIYVTATKIFLSQSLLVNAAVRSTKANQLGILGFGGNSKNENQFVFEGSVAYLFNEAIAIGSEYRMKPDNLKGIKEDAWSDVFIAWAPTKNISLTAAYVDLGSVATRNGQNGSYASLQIGF